MQVKVKHDFVIINAKLLLCTVHVPVVIFSTLTYMVSSSLEDSVILVFVSIVIEVAGSCSILNLWKTINYIQ